VDIFLVVLATLILIALLTFHFQPELSRFEINRLTKQNHKYKVLAQFLDIYLGLLVLTRILALVVAIFLTSFAISKWGTFGGSAISLIVLLLAGLLARLLRPSMQKIINRHLDFLNKYFAWTEFLGGLIVKENEPRIGSQHELTHLIQDGDFLDDATKNLVQNALAFSDKTVRNIMTSRDDLIFLHSRDALTPVLIDELFASGHRLFPVAQGSLDKTVGFLLLDDVLPIDQEEKVLTKVMRKASPAVDANTPLESALRQMCEYRATVLMVTDNEKTVGMLTLHDIVRQLF